MYSYQVFSHSRTPVLQGSENAPLTRLERGDASQRAIVAFGIGTLSIDVGSSQSRGHNFCGVHCLVRRHRLFQPQQRLKSLAWSV
jgi:hypothetical protein